MGAGAVVFIGDAPGGDIDAAVKGEEARRLGAPAIVDVGLGVPGFYGIVILGFARPIFLIVAADTQRMVIQINRVCIAVILGMVCMAVVRVGPGCLVVLELEIHIGVYELFAMKGLTGINICAACQQFPVNIRMVIVTAATGRIAAIRREVKQV